MDDIFRKKLNPVQSTPTFEVNIVNKRRCCLFLGVLLCFAAVILMPWAAFAQEAVTVAGISKVEENHLYMIPVGAQDGLEKGDMVEIIRGDQKLADARLISVLADNSMAEILVMFVRADILESDSVRFMKKKGEPAVRETLGRERTLEAAGKEVPKTVTTTDETRRGLLGSQMHRYEQETAVEGPLQKEIAQLKSALASTKEEYETKVDTIVSSVSTRKDIEAVKKKYRTQYDERKKLLEKEQARLEGKVTELDSQLKVVNEGTDERTQQLLADLENKEDEITNLKKSFLEDRLTGEGEWKEKLDNLETRYESKLKSQKRNFEEKLAKQKEKQEREIAYLKGKLDLVSENADSKNEGLRADLKEREVLIAKLRKEQVSLKADLSREREQVVKLESDNATLKDVFAAAKRVHAKELEMAKQPVEELQMEAMKSDYQAKLKEMEVTAEQSQNKIKEEWKQKLEFQEKTFQGKIVSLKDQLEAFKRDSATVIEELQGHLKDKNDEITSLERKNSDLTLKKKELGRAEDEIEALEKRIRDTEASRAKWIESVKRPFEGEIKKLKNEMELLKKEAKEDLEDSDKRWQTKLKGKEDEIAYLEKNLGSIWEKKLVEAEEKYQRKLKEKKESFQEQAARLNRKVKRLELVNDTLEVEKKKLDSEVGFLKDEAKNWVGPLKTRADDDLRTAEDKWQAKLNAIEAQWKTKWAVREADFEQEKAEALRDLEKELSNGSSREVQQTIVNLNNRLKMLKESSDSQIRDLETDLAAQQYQLSVKEAEYQKRLMDVDRKWSKKLKKAEKEYKEAQAKDQRSMMADFLEEKKELRGAVVDVTKQFNELRDKSSARIKELESEVEEKSYKLSLLENRSQQDLLGAEEKWNAKLTALEEKHQRELMGQKQELEKQFFSDKQKLQEALADLNRKLMAQTSQAKLDLALKDEEKAAEVALLEHKYQDHVTELKEGSSDRLDELVGKVKKQEGRISELVSQKSNLTFDLDQKDMELDRMRSQVQNLNRELKSVELSQAEKTRLAKQSLETQVKELASKLKIAKAKAEQEKQALEDQWRIKLEKAEGNYLQKLKIQSLDLKDEVETLTEKIAALKGDQGEGVQEVQTELEDSQTLVQLLSKEKYELTSRLEEKSRMIVRLNEEIIRLKEGLEVYKNMMPQGSSDPLSSTSKIDEEKLVSKGQSWYTNQNTAVDTVTKEYYSVVRDAILKKFREFDFSKYEGKEGIVKIDFELLANGSPKKKPEFYGTEDQGLKNLLTKCFEDALPFPPFPEEFGKESQRFSLGISFEKK